MAKADIWMPIYIGDYLSDTMHLSTEQNGAYLLLLLYGWRNNGLIPSDDESLSQICRMPLELWKNNRQVISRFFQQGDFWTQKRQIEEIEKAGNRRDAAKSNGIKGGRPKINPPVISGLTIGLPDGKPEANPGESSLQLSLSQDPKEEDKIRESPTSPSGILDIPAKAKKPKAIFPDNSEPMEFADLYKRMYADWTRGTGKPPTPDKLQAWAGVFDAMLRIDGYSSYEIERVMNAIDKEQPGKDGFCWKHVLLSPEKLRKRWGEGKLYKFKKEALNGQAQRR